MKCDTQHTNRQHNNTSNVILSIMDFCYSVSFTPSVTNKSFRLSQSVVALIDICWCHWHFVVMTNFKFSFKEKHFFSVSSLNQKFPVNLFVCMASLDPAPTPTPTRPLLYPPFPRFVLFLPTPPLFDMPTLPSTKISLFSSLPLSLSLSLLFTLSKTYI
jgi:hypothetical protein